MEYKKWFVEALPIVREWAQSEGIDFATILLENTEYGDNTGKGDKREGRYFTVSYRANDNGRRYLATFVEWDGAWTLGAS